MYLNIKILLYALIFKVPTTVSTLTTLERTLFHSIHIYYYDLKVFYIHYLLIL